jgi:iron complex transport system ATP-binding protein
MKGIREISGGERQLVVLARAIVQQTPILLLDEPTAHLDVRHQRVFSRVLSEMSDKGKTVVLVSHDLNLAAGLCSRMLMLDAGEIRADGPPWDVIRTDLIERVYGVKLIVTRHPESGRPCLLMPA